jgi:hypothetical protein
MGKVAETLGGGLITGPATIVSGIMQSKAQNKATDAQSKSAAETLAFAREQEAQRKAVYEQKMAQYTAMRNTLAQRYGIDIGTPPAAGHPSARLPERPTGPSGGHIGRSDAEQAGSSRPE